MLVLCSLQKLPYRTIRILYLCNTLYRGYSDDKIRLILYFISLFQDGDEGGELRRWCGWVSVLTRGREDGKAVMWAVVVFTLSTAGFLIGLQYSFTSLTQPYPAAWAVLLAVVSSPILFMSKCLDVSVTKISVQSILFLHLMLMNVYSHK